MAGDLSDEQTLTEIVALTEPDWVIHLAAEIATQRDEAKLREVNVEGTRRLLAACRTRPGVRFVFFSTVVTGDAAGAVLDEDATLPVQTATAAPSGKASGSCVTPDWTP